MRRRAADYRRPVRRRLSCWIWSLLGIFTIAGFVLFVVHHHQDHVEQPILVSLEHSRPRSLLVLVIFLALAIIYNSSSSMSLLFDIVEMFLLFSREFYDLRMCSLLC